MENFSTNWLRSWDHGDRIPFNSCEIDPVRIMGPVAFARERLGFSPDEKQELVLRGGRRGIVNCTRQWGKSTVTAAKAVHRAHSRRSFAGIDTLCRNDIYVDQRMANDLTYIGALVLHTIRSGQRYGFQIM